MKKKTNITNSELVSPLNYRDDFDAVCGIITTHRNRVATGIINESLMASGIVPIRLAQSQSAAIVPFEMAQNKDANPLAQIQYGIDE